MNAHRPEGSAVALVAEVGNAATGKLSLVIAHHDGATLSLALWRFTSTGDDDTLVPVGPPQPLLALRATETTDTDSLEEIVRTRAAGHTVGGRPQGIAASDAPSALLSLHGFATVALDPDATPEARAEALAAFTRGLDDALLFSRTGLSRALAALANTATPSAPQGSERRASVRWGQTTVSLLRKGDGWAVDSLE
ncbi:MAG: hypothetical protein ACRBN8_05795 [Nannocystales bacterium]